MHILTILGSPHKRGNTEAVLHQFEELARLQHTVERINVVDYKINGCLGCDSCMKRQDEPGCVQKDDFAALADRILQADLVVYAAPVYVWNFPAQIKALFDRHYCMVKWKDGQVAACLMEDKPTALLLTCGGDAQGNLDLPQQAFTREIDYLQARLCGMYAVADVTSREDAAERGRAVARQMALELLPA